MALIFQTSYQEAKTTANAVKSVVTPSFLVSAIRDKITGLNSYEIIFPKSSGLSASTVFARMTSPLAFMGGFDEFTFPALKGIFTSSIAGFAIGSVGTIGVSFVAGYAFDKIVLSSYMLDETQVNSMVRALTSDYKESYTKMSSNYMKTSVGNLGGKIGDMAKGKISVVNAEGTVEPKSLIQANLLGKKTLVENQALLNVQLDFLEKQINRELQNKHGVSEKSKFTFNRQALYEELKDITSTQTTAKASNVSSSLTELASEQIVKSLSKLLLESTNSDLVAIMELSNNLRDPTRLKKINLEYTLELKKFGRNSGKISEQEAFVIGMKVIYKNMPHSFRSVFESPEAFAKFATDVAKLTESETVLKSTTGYRGILNRLKEWGTKSPDRFPKLKAFGKRMAIGAVLMAVIIPTSLVIFGGAGEESVKIKGGTINSRNLDYSKLNDMYYEQATTSSDNLTETQAAENKAQLDAVRGRNIQNMLVPFLAKNTNLPWVRFNNLIQFGLGLQRDAQFNAYPDWWENKGQKGGNSWIKSDWAFYKFNEQGQSLTNKKQTYGINMVIPPLDKGNRRKVHTYFGVQAIEVGKGGLGNEVFLPEVGFENGVIYFGKEKDKVQLGTYPKGMEGKSVWVSITLVPPAESQFENGSAIVGVFVGGKNVLENRPPIPLKENFKELMEGGNLQNYEMAPSITVMQ